MRIAAVLVVGALAAAACSTAQGPTADSVGSTTAAIASSTTAPVVTTTTQTTVSDSVEPAPTTTVHPPTTVTEPQPTPLSSFELDVVPVVDGFDQPVLVSTRPDDDRLIVTDQPGVVYAVDVSSGTRRAILDIVDRVRFAGEQGLLGAAFHPDDPARLFVHYTALDGSTVVAVYTLGADGTADPGSGRVVLEVEQPARNHNGGMIDFGPDGLLYIGLGDGGGSGDQFDNGQDPFTLLGSILRVDVDTVPYSVPEGNPFVDGLEGAPEVWAWGLRNPWRFSFDGNDLWVGDVGQGAIEEIDRFDIGRPGDNAGWPLLEGTRCFRVDPCVFDSFLAPAFEYAHQGGRCSVTGGVVYRGASIPELFGTYLYGDFCSGEIWGLRTEGALEHRLFTNTDDVFLPRLSGLTSFGTGPDGEVYVVQASGTIWRLVASG